MPEGENEQEHRWQCEDSNSFNMVWQLYRPGYGNAVELTTGARSLVAGPGLCVYSCPERATNRRAISAPAH